MRIRVVGDCDAARVLRKKLLVAGFVVSDTIADYTVHLESSQTTNDNVIRVDSIPCDLESLVLLHISKLTATDLRISRQTGKIFSDNEIRVIIPLVPADSYAVELGIIRALLDLTKSSGQVSEAEKGEIERPSVEAVNVLPWYKKMFSK